MNKRFPCPYCKGQGTWIEPVTDEGEGPMYECGCCEGQGMIEVDGPIHQKIKDAHDLAEGQSITVVRDRR